MTASLTATEQLRSLAWFLHAEFHVSGHPQIVDIQTERMIPEYVQKIIATRAPFGRSRYIWQPVECSNNYLQSLTTTKQLQGP